MLYERIGHLKVGPRAHDVGGSARYDVADMAGNAAAKEATYEDLFSIPEHHIGQVVHGVLYSHPRPAARHSVAASELGGDLLQRFSRGRGGPGGWFILDEPELHLGRDIIVPDLAGWRRERMPEVPDATAFELAPDWACEVLSPSTAKLDRGPKREVYAREKVPHLWFVDPAAKTVDVLRLDGATYRVVQSFAEDAIVRAEPFDAVELELGFLWLREIGER